MKNEPREIHDCLVEQEQQQQQLGVDASVAASSSSATGATQFGNVTSGSVGLSNSTVIVIVVGVLLAAVGAFVIWKNK